MFRPTDEDRELQSPELDQSQGKPFSGIAGELFQEPYRFDFFQAVRLLQQLAPHRVPIGEDGPQQKEALDLAPIPSLDFPPSTIYDIRLPTASNRKPLLLQAFVGLTGPSGVLPRHYTELIRRLELHERFDGRHSLRDWFDIFNHRLCSLFFRAWAKYRLPHCFEERMAGHPGRDPISQTLFCLIGLGTDGLRNRLLITAPRPESSSPAVPMEPLARIDDLALLRYAGSLAHSIRNATCLGGMIRDFFGLPAEVEQFRGQWIQLGEANQTQLGDNPIGSNNSLGVDTVVGEEVWDIEGQFRIRLGPLNHPQFLEFLPDPTPTQVHKSIYLLSHLVRFYTGPEFEFDVQLVLQAGQIPPTKLRSDFGDFGDYEEGVGSRLGWNTWLEHPNHEDVDDATFEVDAVSELPSNIESWTEFPS